MTDIEGIKDAERMLELHPDKYFRCGECGFIFEKTTPEDELTKEYKENFPNDPEMKMPIALTCDDCYQKLHKETNGFTKKPSFLGSYYDQWSIDNE